MVHYIEVLVSSCEAMWRPRTTTEKFCATGGMAWVGKRKAGNDLPEPEILTRQGDSCLSKGLEHIGLGYRAGLLVRQDLLKPNAVVRRRGLLVARGQIHFPVQSRPMLNW